MIYSVDDLFLEIEASDTDTSQGMGNDGLCGN
jgi:hypothetical protein